MGMGLPIILVKAQNDSRFLLSSGIGKAPTFRICLLN